MIDNIPIAPIIILDDVVGVVGVGVVVSPLMLFLVGVEGSGVSAIVGEDGREAEAIVTLMIVSKKCAVVGADVLSLLVLRVSFFL